MTKRVKIIQLAEAEDIKKEDIKLLLEKFAMVILAINFVSENIYEWLVYLNPSLKSNDYKHVFKHFNPTDTAPDHSSLLNIECSGADLKKRLHQCELIFEDISTNILESTTCQKEFEGEKHNAPLELKIDICISFANGESSIIDIINRYKEQLASCGYKLSDIESPDEYTKGEAQVKWADKVYGWMNELLTSGYLIKVHHEINGIELYPKNCETTMNYHV